MEDIYKQELIRKFLDEELQGEEIGIFQNLFKEDPEFAKEVKTDMDTIISLKTAASIHSKQLSSGYVHFQRRRTILLAAAAILVLISFGGGYFYLNRPLNSQEIFESFYRKPEGFVILGNNNDFQGIFRDTSNINIVQLFNLSITYIEKKEFENAISGLCEVLKRKPNLYMDQSEWYLALCYLQTHQLELAHQQLAMIAASQNPFNSKAEEILTKWGRIKK